MILSEWLVIKAYVSLRVTEKTRIWCYRRWMDFAFHSDITILSLDHFAPSLVTFQSVVLSFGWFHKNQCFPFFSWDSYLWRSHWYSPVSQWNIINLLAWGEAHIELAWKGGRQLQRNYFPQSLCNTKDKTSELLLTILRHCFQNHVKNSCTVLSFSTSK